MRAFRNTWSKLSPYAEGLVSTANNLSSNQAILGGAAIGAGYSMIEDQSVSAAVSPRGFLNMGLGAASAFGVKKYGTTIYSKVDDRIMRSGVDKATFNHHMNRARSSAKSQGINLPEFDYKFNREGDNKPYMVFKNRKGGMAYTYDMTDNGMVREAPGF